MDDYPASVSIGATVGFAFMGTGLALLGWSRRDRFWFFAGIVTLVALGIILARDGLIPFVVAGPISASRTLAALLIGALIWAEALGLPRPLAELLGIGTKNRALTFDRRLRRVRQPFVDAITLAQTDPGSQGRSLGEARHHVRVERSLRPPDRDWALLRDDIADDDEGWIELLDAGVPPERLADHAEAFQPLMERWTQLREEAARRQRAASTPARRRRGNIVWLATFAAVGLLIGGTYLFEYGLATTAADPGHWFALVALVGGIVAAGGAVVVAVRDRGSPAI